MIIVWNTIANSIKIHLGRWITKWDDCLVSECIVKTIFYSTICIIECAPMFANPCSTKEGGGCNLVGEILYLCFKNLCHHFRPQLTPSQWHCSLLNHQLQIHEPLCWSCRHMNRRMSHHSGHISACIWAWVLPSTSLPSTLPPMPVHFPSAPFKVLCHLCFKTGPNICYRKCPDSYVGTNCTRSRRIPLCQWHFLLVKIVSHVRVYGLEGVG
jgi:hypothetical protein